MNEQYQIFISYRRRDSEGKISGRDIAARIKEELTHRGYKVFFDFDNITDGEFEEKIIPAVRHSAVFILVLSPDSLVRCSDCNDWVRREIKEALDSRSKIITINPDDAFTGWPLDFPTELEMIKGVQITTINMESLFSKSIDYLEEQRLHNIIYPARPLQFHKEDNASFHCLKIKSDVDVVIYIDGNNYGMSMANNIYTAQLVSGKYLLDIESCEENVLKLSFDIDLTNDVIHRVSFGKDIERLRGIKIFNHEEKYGLADAMDNIILNPIFDHIHPFSEGFAVFYDRRKCGYINKLGEIVISPQYESAGDFHNGYAKVQRGAKEGFIDKYGNEIIPIVYDFVNSFDENGLAMVELNSKYGYINRFNRAIIPLEYEDLDYKFIENHIGAKKDGKYGVINISGKIVAPFIYDDVGAYNHGYAKVKMKDRWGIIDYAGSIVLPIEFDDIGIFGEGIFPTKKEGKWGAVTRDGNLIIPYVYDEMTHFCNELSAVKVAGKYGYISKNNIMNIPLEYSFALPFTSKGLAGVEKDGVLYLVDKTGRCYEYDPSILRD